MVLSRKPGFQIVGLFHPCPCETDILYGLIDVLLIPSPIASRSKRGRAPLTSPFSPTAPAGCSGRVNPIHRRMGYETKASIVSCQTFNGPINSSECPRKTAQV
jgi:hypothetical protein